MRGQLGARERERTWLLFAFAVFVGFFNYWEIQRRGKVNEGHDDARREWVDGQLRGLQDEARDSRTRKLTREGIVKALYALGILLGTALAGYAAFRAASN